MQLYICLIKWPVSGRFVLIKKFILLICHLSFYVILYKTNSKLGLMTLYVIIQHSKNVQNVYRCGTLSTGYLLYWWYAQMTSITIGSEGHTPPSTHHHHQCSWSVGNCKFTCLCFALFYFGLLDPSNSRVVSNISTWVLSPAPASKPWFVFVTLMTLNVTQKTLMDNKYR